MKAADNADVDRMTKDQFVAMLLVASSNDNYLDSELQRLRNPTVQECRAIMEDWDRGNNYADQATGSNSAGASVFAVKQQQGRGQQRGRGQKGPPRQQGGGGGPRVTDDKVKAFLQGKCFRCADKRHTGENCERKNLVCDYCQKPGHTKAICISFHFAQQKPQQARQVQEEGAQARSADEGAAAARSAHSRPTPPLSI
jgi:hypothetical protein